MRIVNSCDRLVKEGKVRLCKVSEFSREVSEKCKVRLCEVSEFPH